MINIQSNETFSNIKSESPHKSDKLPAYNTPSPQKRKKSKSKKDTGENKNVTFDDEKDTWIFTTDPKIFEQAVYFDSNAKYDSLVQEIASFKDTQSKIIKMIDGNEKGKMF